MIDFDQLMKDEKKIYVLYHSNCLDGSGARYAAEKKFGNKAEYIPVQYGRKLPKLIDGSCVFILDFAFTRELMDELYERMELLMVVDHHETAMKALQGRPYAIFDMERSGAVMAWEFFHPGTEVPQILLHVQDRDLWKFLLPGTRELMAGLMPRQKLFNTWDLAASDSEDGRYFMEMLHAEGRPLVQYTDDQVRISRSQTKVIDWLGYKVGIVNTTALISEVNQGIYMDEELAVDFSITFFVNTIDNQVILSFRSKGNVNVEELARTVLGGGGHQKASGARVTLKYLEKMITGKLARGTTGYYRYILRREFNKLLGKLRK